MKALKALRIPKLPTNVQKALRKKDLQDKVLSKQPAQLKSANDGKKVVGEAKRKAKTADRGDKTQAVAKKVLPEVNQVRKKVEGMTVDQLSTKFTGKELKSMEMKLKQASKPNQALLKKLSKARDQRTGMVEASETPSDRPQSTPAKFRKKGGMVKRKGGGKVYERQYGGPAGKAGKKGPAGPAGPAGKEGKADKKKMKKKMGGGKVYKRGHGGKVMSGQDFVNSFYD